MPVLVTLSYLVHVLSAALWTGGVLYATYAVFPAARAGELSPAAFEQVVDGLLQVTRWTGLALPLSGGYQLWVLYPVDRLLGTTSGYLVLAMLALWGLMNGLLEAGVYRMRTAGGEPLGMGEYMTERFAVNGGYDVRERAAVGRPYLLGVVVLAVLLLVDAALLAVG